MTERQRDLTAGPLGRTLFAMAGPMLIGYLALISVNIVDTYFVGQLGEQELAAMGFCFPLIMLMASFASGTAGAVQSVVSRALGSGDRELARRSALHGVALGVAGTIVLTTLGLHTLESALQSLGASGEVLQLATSYLRIWLIALLFYVTPLVAGSAMMAAGDAIRPMVFLIVGALVNGIMDPLLIFGLGPFPKLGIEGAAIASATARLVATAATVVALIQHPVLGPRRSALAGILSSWREILRIGVPSTLNALIYPASVALVTATLATMGEHVVAAYAAGSRIDSLSALVFTSVGFGLAPIVGQNWGAGLRARVISGFALGVKVCALWGVGAWIALAVAASPIASAFAPNSASASALVAYLTVMPAAYAALGAVAVCQQVLTSIGKSTQSAIIAGASAAGAVAAATVGAPWGVHTVFGATVAFEAIVAAVSATYVFWLLKNHPTAVRPGLTG